MKKFFVKNCERIFFITAIAVCALNSVIHLTQTRYVNFNYLTFIFTFEVHVGHYLHIQNGHLLFLIYCIVNIGLIYLLMNMMKSRLSVLGIIVAILYALAQIPIFDTTKIHI